MWSSFYVIYYKYFFERKISVHAKNINLQTKKNLLEAIMNLNHIPVLLNESINGLNIKTNGIYIDGIVGGGGHSFFIAQKIFKGAKSK